MKILFVEDNPDDIFLIREVLDSAKIHYQPLFVRQEDDFVNALAEFRPEVILCDHTLPDFDSVTALNYVTKLTERPVFILVTGSVSEEFAVWCLKNGADDYILKSSLKRLPSVIEKELLLKTKETRFVEEQHRNLENEMFFSMLSEATPVAFYITNNFEVLHISDNVKDITGYDKKCFISDPGFWASRVHPDDAHLINLDNEDLLKRENFTREYRWKVSDGTYKWFHDRTNLIARNNKIYMIGVWMDITARKITEEKLLEKISDLDSLLYRTSHDLLGPVMSVKGLVNIGRMDSQDDESLKIFNMIEKSSLKLENILRKFISVSTVLQKVVEPSVIRVDECIEQIIKNIETYGDEVSIIFESAEKKFITDRDLLDAILTELLRNSLTFTHSGREHKVVVKVSVDKELQIMIEDNGIGFDNLLNNKLFKMFGKANENFEGEGLGLFVVRNALEKIDGRISMNSQYGTGTEVTIKIPPLKSLLSGELS